MWASGSDTNNNNKILWRISWNEFFLHKNAFFHLMPLPKDNLINKNCDVKIEQQLKYFRHSNWSLVIIRDKNREDKYGKTYNIVPRRRADVILLGPGQRDGSIRLQRRQTRRIWEIAESDWGALQGSAKQGILPTLNRVQLSRCSAMRRERFPRRSHLGSHQVAIPLTSSLRQLLRKATPFYK